jgi:hypothetical protein
MATRWIWMSMLMGSLLAAACKDQGYRQGDCDPGYLEVDGECKLAVGQPCDKNSDCLANRCVKEPDQEGFCTITCRADEQCPTGFYCTSWADKLCYPGTRPPPCLADEDCQPCEECSDGICRTISGCVVCSSDEDCQSCQRCDQSICIEVAGCTPCTVDGDCPPCEVCNQNGECRRDLGCILCTSDQDCPGCMQCTQGACEEIPGCGTEACFTDSDCPSRTKCVLDPELGHFVCMPSDLPFGSDCSRGGDEICAEGFCLLGEGGEATCTRACIDDTDCPAPTRCLPDDDCLWLCRELVTPPPGNSCQNDADCTEGRTCGLVVDDTGTAWSPRCLVPLSCAAASGETCDPEAGDRCVTGICTREGYCSPVCAADYDCPEGFLCDQLLLPLPSGDDAPFRGCAPEDLVKGEVGEACPNGDADCKSGLCLVDEPEGPHPFCSRECTPGAAECPDGFDCRQSPVDQRNLCQPSLAGGACGNDQDCATGEICTLDPLLGTTLCDQPLPGGAQPGEPCSIVIECANDLCLQQGFCGAMCVDPADCPADFICDYLEVIQSGGGSAFAKVCVPDPGSMLPCQRDGDCLAGEVCGLALNAWGTGLEGRCTAAGPGGGVGTACSEGYQCENFFCSTEYQCTSLCAEDADCPQDYACFEIWVEWGQSGIFPVRACLQTGTVRLGAPCPHGDIDCQNGLFCYQAENESYCSKECQTDADCQVIRGSPPVLRPPLACLDDGTGNLYCLYP